MRTFIAIALFFSSVSLAHAQSSSPERVTLKLELLQEALAARKAQIDAEAMRLKAEEDAFS